MRLLIFLGGMICSVFLYGGQMDFSLSEKIEGCFLTGLDERTVWNAPAGPVCISKSGMSVWNKNGQSTALLNWEMSKNAVMEFSDPVMTDFNIMVGPQSDWVTGLNLYRTMTVKNFRDGLDVILSWDEQRRRLGMSLRSDRPHKDFSFELPGFIDTGANILTRNIGSAELVVETLGTVEFNDSGSDTEKIIFDASVKSKAGASHIVWFTFLNGDGSEIIDYPLGIAVQPDGNVLVYGTTGAANMINLFFDEKPGKIDMFLAVYNPVLNQITKGVLFGGKEDEVLEELRLSQQPYGGLTVKISCLSVNSSGHIAIAGGSKSNDLPVTPGVVCDSGEYFGFVAVFNSDLELEVCTYFDATPYNILLLDSGEILLTGKAFKKFTYFTSSRPNWNGTDAAGFVTKLDASCSTRLFSHLFNIAVSNRMCITMKALCASDSHVWVGGIVWPDSDVSFPTGFQPNPETAADGFVVQMDIDSGEVLAGTFIGGNGLDIVTDLTWVPDTGLLLGGMTNSSDFPVTDSAYMSAINQDNDLFLAFMNSSLDTLTACTYFGGNHEDTIAKVIYHYGLVYIGLEGRSDDLPTHTDAWRRHSFLLEDIYVGALSADLSSFIRGTYYGSNNTDYLGDMALDTDSSVWLVGNTDGNDISATPNAPQPECWKTLPGLLAHFSSVLSDLNLSTYFMASGSSSIRAMAGKSNGNVVFSGVVYGPFKSGIDALFPDNLGGYSDIILGEFTPDGASLEWLTVLGGAGEDANYHLVLNDDDEIFIAGATKSDDFPLPDDAYDTTQRGGLDGLLVHLNERGDQILGGTLLGATAQDEICSIALKDNGDIIAAGNTDSPLFPTTAGAFDRVNSGAQDGFVSVLSGDMQNLKYSTFLGGMDFDRLLSVSYSSTYGVFVSGYTRSVNFPTVLGSFQAINKGGMDGFAARLLPDLSDLVYGTYIGGRDWDKCLFAKLKPDGRYCLAGLTISSDFPTIQGSADPNYHGYKDSFICELNRNGTELNFSTIVGSSEGDDCVTAMALHPNGMISVGGNTTSTDTFPATPGASSSSHSPQSWFISAVNDSGACTTFSSLFGQVPGWLTSDDYLETPTALVPCGNDGVIVSGYCRYNDFYEFYDATPGTFGEIRQTPDQSYFFRVNYNAQGSCSLKYRSLAMGLNPIQIEFDSCGLNTGTDVSWLATPNCSVQYENGVLLVSDTNPGLTTITVTTTNSCIDFSSDYTLHILTAYTSAWLDYDDNGVNQANDLYAALPLWHTSAENDPNQTGFINLLDYLYIRSCD